MTLRFLPLIARDAREIYALQILRGAAVRPRDLVNPLNWREACHSVAIPLVDPDSSSGRSGLGRCPAARRGNCDVSAANRRSQRAGRGGLTTEV